MSDTRHFAVHYPASLGARAGDLSGRAERAYDAVTRQLGLHPPGRIPLYLYGQHRDFRAAAGIYPHDLVVGTSEETGGLIRLDASGAFSDPDATLRHEIVHSVLARGLNGHVHDIPLWMNEGLAQIVDQVPNPGAEEEARQARGEGRLRTLSELSVEFPHGEDGGVAYAEAYSATAYMVRDYGWGAVRELLRRVRGGAGFTAAFRAATGDGIADFYAGWEASLVRRGWVAWMQLFYAPAVTFGMLWTTWLAYRTVMLRRRALLETDEATSTDAGEDVARGEENVTK